MPPREEVAFCGGKFYGESSTHDDLSMIITTFGTRGSLPVSGPYCLRHGGNTTCVRVESEALPPHSALVIDAGSGFLPLAKEALASGVKRFFLFQTHYHHDHTQGLLIAPPLYRDDIQLDIFGPVEREVGPREVYERLMQQPLHPVPFSAVVDHLSFHRIENPATVVIIIHPIGGALTLDLEKFRRVGRDTPLDFHNGSYPFKECLLITMHYTEHPERTFAYRFDEQPTGRSFVFMTDEEVRASLPATLKRFVSKADLLIQDAQFSEDAYHARAAGWGHGTPRYAARVAREGGVSRLGLTHHDALATDWDIDAQVKEADDGSHSGSLEVFSCFDGMKIDLS